MNKIILSILLIILVSSLVLAQGSNDTIEARAVTTGMAIDTTLDNMSNSSPMKQLRDNSDMVKNRTPLKLNGSTSPMGPPDNKPSLPVVTSTSVKSVNFTTGSGKSLQLQEKSANNYQLKAGNSIAETRLELVQNKSQLRVKLSNGKNAELKILPDVASKTAMTQLKMKVCSAEQNCTIELKEVGSGNTSKVAYEVQAQKQAKILGLFKTKMQVQAQIDAETGEVINFKKPWWAFLASESQE